MSFCYVSFLIVISGCSLNSGEDKSDVVDYDEGSRQHCLSIPLISQQPRQLPRESAASWI